MTGIIAFPLFPYLQIRSKILVCLIYKVIRQEKDASRMHRINDMIHESQSLSVFFLPSGIGETTSGIIPTAARIIHSHSCYKNIHNTFSDSHVINKSPKSQDGRRHLPHLRQVRTYNKTTSCRLVESSSCSDEMTLSLFKF